MDNETKAGIDQLEQTVNAEQLANGAERPQTESGVQAKEKYKLDNSHIEVEEQ